MIEVLEKSWHVWMKSWHDFGCFWEAVIGKIVARCRR